MPAAMVSRLDDEIQAETVRVAAPPSEYARPEPRFRVVTRKPLPPARRRRGNPVRNALLLAAFPTCFLLAYVLFWTMAIGGAFKRDRLQSDITRLRIEQAELRALKLAQQSPGVIFAGAKRLGMEPAGDNKRYARLPAEQRPVAGKVEP